MSESTASIPEPDVSEEHPISEHWVWVGPHRPPCPRVLFEHMTGNWEIHARSTEVYPGAIVTAERRQKLGEHFTDKTLVIPTGNPKVRANDTDYNFRPGTDFYYLTGCFESDTVLVISPSATGPRSTLYVAERRDHHTHEFFTDARYGELWVGPRRGVVEAAHFYDIETESLEHLAKDLASLPAGNVLSLRNFDKSVDQLVAPNDDDALLAQFLSEMRLAKDAFEIAQLQLAIDYTVKGFTDVVQALPSAEGRGERVIEGIFNLRARVEGNDVGYNTIAASGSHATILHWTRNDGAVRRGDLLLLDAGVECHNLYTADVTRNNAHKRQILSGAAPHLRPGARSPRSGHCCREAWRVVHGAQPSCHEGPCQGTARNGHLEGIARRGLKARATTPPALHPARGLPHVGYRRARLLERQERNVPRRTAGRLRSHG